MLSKLESGKKNGEDSKSGQLLRDIEAISKALYLHKSPPVGLISTSNNRSKSAGKTRFPESKLNPKSDVIKEGLLLKDKKSSIWNWKKPLKALTNIRNRKFSCNFFLQVHSIEGLPANFNDISLCIHWKRKDEVLRTCPSRVDQGMAEFEETLMHRCSVYGHRSGHHDSTKYEVKLSLVYASVIGVPGLDIGKHWVDLTRLLPLRMEELEEEKSTGKWTTSFKLAGKAEGAILNVSFGYSVMWNNSVEPGSEMNVPEILNLNHHRSSTMENVAGFAPGNAYGMLRRVGSIPSNKNHHGPRLSSQSIDVRVLHEVLPNPGAELSRSINFIYQNLDEAKLGSSAEFDLFSERLLPLNPKHVSFSESAEEHFGNECNDIEFTVIDKGVELSTKEHVKLEESAEQTFDGFAVEIIDVDEIIKSDGVAVDEEIKCNVKDDVYANYNNEVVVDECKYEENSASTKDSTMEELESTFDSLLLQESVDLCSPLTMSEFLQRESYMEVKSNDEASTMVKSLGLDDLTESVASDFLNMLETEHSPSGLSSDGDPESPRELLLRQFEMEALASGNFIFDIDAKGEEVEVGSVTPTASRMRVFPEDSEFSLVIQATEQDHSRASQSLISKRKAKMLENLETEALMREWGLNEMAFLRSPGCSSGGFGSPIDLYPEEPLELPPLGEGLGPFLQMKGGGFLRSMNPCIFRNAEHGGSLIMQVSSPVVLPAEMGSALMEILQYMASIGIEKLSMQANILMPLEDITGKTMQQVAWEAETILEPSERMTMLQHESEVEQDSFDGSMEANGFSSSQNYDDLDSTSIRDEMGSDYVSLTDLAPWAMDKIEALSVEGLRIQCSMSDEEAPSCICPRAFEGVGSNFGEFLSLGEAVGLQLLNVGDNDFDVDGLMGLSITLDEWLRLDAGIVGDEDHLNERTLKILAAHHAKCTDLFSGRLTRDGERLIEYGRKCGLFGNSLTVAFMVQLRDPLRNYEPVGAPMLALSQVERLYVPLKQKNYCLPLERSNKKEDDDLYEPVVKEEINDMRKEEKEDEEGGVPQFKITEVHVAGLNTEPGKRKLWGNTAQHQSGSRWLLRSGMCKTNKHPFLKSKAIIKSLPLATAKVQPRDALWSISSCVHGTGAKWRELASLNLHIRNPDITFLNEAIRL